MKSWKKEIKEAFWAPPPKRKEAFLTEHLHDETSLWEFLISQSGCLSKSTGCPWLPCLDYPCFWEASLLIAERGMPSGWSLPCCPFGAVWSRRSF